MNNQPTDNIATECLQLPDCHKRGLLRMIQTATKPQSLSESNLALYARISGLPETRQVELVKMLEEDLYDSDRLLARNMRLSKKRNGGKAGWPEVEDS